jgi:hypothetical protein
MRSASTGVPNLPLAETVIYHANRHMSGWCPQIADLDDIDELPTEQVKILAQEAKDRLAELGTIEQERPLSPAENSVGSRLAFKQQAHGGGLRRVCLQPHRIPGIFKEAAAP